MAEEVLFESEGKRSRSDVAAMLRGVADKLEAGEPVTVSEGDRSITVDPPSSPTFEVKAERETGSGPDEMSIEFELEWDENESGGDGSDGDLRIE
ncbi:amphi-Trp domain-containing protein [Halostella sp. JP-L12]|uniref:amphi-Trp domain-containing protein n=1 Tax=Halostella TaxID=1843185 RepID=UPI000EF7ABDC|nr:MULTISPECIES: amphi-Trp domain-containing protein [Halostella]NHN48442.1 amphi-Trp domain-containing protein [Halostella sp. JP-L12]